MSEDNTQFELEKYDLYSAEFKANVYDTYTQMRNESPIRLHKGLQVPIWFVTGYEEAKLVLGDSKRFVKDYTSTLLPEERAKLPDGPDVYDLLNSTMLNADRPDHTRLRALVSKAFTQKRIQSLEPRIQAIADELIAKFPADGEIDLIDAYAFQLPIIVICEMLGIPVADRELFREWSAAFIELSDNEDETILKLMSFVNYLNKFVDERREDPRDDLVSALIAAEESGEKLSQSELFSMIALLIVAGHETTVNLISNGIMALLQHPDQLEKLLQDRSLIDSAVEEALRYDGAVERTTVRFAAEDTVLNGIHIKRSTPIIAVVGAANRDPAHFDQPEVFDIARTQNSHLDFGYGIHYCLGAPLARMEGRIAIMSLIERFPNMKIAVPIDQLVYRRSTLVRGVTRLPIKLS